jgi:hypothetical protein
MEVNPMVKSTEDSGKFKSFDIYECLTERSSKFYCVGCFADIESECICDRIVGYDAVNGYPLVDITDEEWAYLYGQ